MKIKPGDLVQMNLSNARWHLKHPEIYTFNGSSWDSNYDEETLIHLMCIFDIPVIGKVIRPGSMKRTWYVHFKVANLNARYVVERRSITLL